ncbi:hypothetical protein MCUN1_000592 [Malassezia cuniculi]|uniref:Cell division cycle protein 123 n=1 Tax=Malassezia cuniculi TaxID=948313 RepID=A0AAF0EP90_9BASI|nr:hypothetical protein MCUN1_000592 [Malassezia cuniculi]
MTDKSANDAQTSSDDAGAQLTPPAVALHATQYNEWYPRHARVAPRSVIIDVASIEPDFLAWLEADGLVLPKNSGVARPANQKRRDDMETDAMSLPSDDEDDEDAPEFPALTSALRKAIDEYGAVFPKVNWSAPLDAAWMMPGNTLKCNSPSDVYLLLKSSDFVARDVEQVAELAQAVPDTKLVLVLKEWVDMPHAHEFRCFVRDGRLIAICQREIAFYEHLQNADAQETIRRTINKFFQDHIANDTLRDCMFDVHLNNSLGRAKLIDINPWLPRTDTLLWTYEELDEAAESAAADSTASSAADSTASPAKQPAPLRVISSRAQASQSQPTYACNMVPADVKDVGEGKNVAEFARQWHDYLAASTAEDP